jgi:RimJ/RimL family protein N-acetyltransferase
VSDAVQPPAPPVAGVDLVPLGAEVLQALIDGDLAAAGAAAGVPLPHEYLADTWLWTLRLGQLVGEPACAPWLIRAVVPRADGIAVGHAGFHGPPDERGMVEVGYRIVPAHRRRGFARAALTELLIYAAGHGATVARASIAPDNEASLGLARSFGFVHVGEQIDEIDGLELVFERSLT